MFAFRSETLSIPNRGTETEQWKMVRKDKWAKKRRKRVRSGMVVAGKTEMLATESEKKNGNCGKFEEEKETAIPTRTFPLFYRRRDFPRVRLFGLSTKLLELSHFTSVIACFFLTFREH